MVSTSVHVQSVLGWSSVSAQPTIVGGLDMFGLNMSFKSCSARGGVTAVMTLPLGTSIGIFHFGNFRRN